MSVTDFECAIAKSQIGRYIAGDNLAPEIARQLETHINNCTRCKGLLQEKKSSLEAMINEETRPVLNVVESQIPMTTVPMTNGSSALKPDYMGALADSARASLRETLKASTRTEPHVAEIPTVAPAFAYNEEETDSIPVQAPQTYAKRKGLSLSTFALFKDVPDEVEKPALSVENIRSARAVFRDSQPSMKKPALYLAGLCAVVGAMSFVLRDPTTLFGGKATDFAKTAPHNSVTGADKTAKVAKVLQHKPTTLNAKGTDAQSFTTDLPKKSPKKPAKKTAKPKTTKVARKSTAKPDITIIRKHTPKKVAAHHFVAPTHPKPRHHATKKTHKSTTDSGVVKIYTPETTPKNQEPNK